MTNEIAMRRFSESADTVHDGDSGAELRRLAGVVDGLHRRISDLLDATDTADHILVREGDNYHVIPIATIEMVMADGNYVRLHTSQHVIRQRVSITSYEQKLNGRRFARVHRSVIVNLDAVTGISPAGAAAYAVHLKSGAQARISRACWAEFAARLSL